MDDNELVEEEGRKRDSKSTDCIGISTSGGISNKSSPSHSRLIDSSAPSEVASSPIGSQTSQSTSSRQGERRRVVELLQQAVEEVISQSEDNWMIGDDFYHEDVAADDEEMSDGSDEDDDQLSADDNPDDDEDDDVEVLGFEVAPNEFDHLADTSSGEDDDEDDDAIDYDITIPVQHRYLGDNLEESRGRRILVENSVVPLTLFNIRQIVLLPGQVLPMKTDNLNPRIQMILQSCITRGNCLIGLVSSPRENPFGTTAEIRNYARSSDEHGEEEIKMIMEGRQRFKLLSQPFDTAIEGLVMILPEISLGRPFLEIPSWKRFVTRGAIPSKLIVSKHPKWLIHHYEAHSLTKRITNEIKEWCRNAPSSDPSDFSYWLASNLPISNLERIKVLKLDCTEARLMWLLNLLSEKEYLGCSACRNVICHRKDVFLMSCSGPQNSFVNSDGYVHDTLTVSKANGLVYQSSWSNRYTWFPGYSWRIASCEYCSKHIGWCYKSSESDTRPRKFWGLSRVNVQLQSDAMVATDEDSSQIIVF